MVIRIGIATKIFALAVSLLGLTVALSVFGTWQTREIHRDLTRIAQVDLPLEELVKELDYIGLLRRMEFERWLAQLQRPHPDAQELERIAASHGRLTHSGFDHVVHLKKILDEAPRDPADASDLAALRQEVDEVERVSPLITGLRLKIVSRQLAGDTADIPELMTIHDDLQDNLQQVRSAMDKRILDLTQRAANAAAARERRALEVTAFTTSLAVVFGLVFAWLMARRMIQPVEVLIGGLRSVEQGDLTVLLQVRTTDEIGALTMSFNKLVEELRAKARLKETFGKYVDPRIVESVILNPSLAETEGGRREMTISFCDLVGFTGIGEQLAPWGMVRLLNRHFGLMAEAIHGNQGVVDKLIGDAVMAFWGPPFTKATDHATLACRTALAQLRALDRFRAELPDLTGLRKNLPVIDLRIGLASGDVVAGNIGAENARSYTVIGDTVNLASRIEGVNRVYGTRILMNGETRRLAGTAIETREIDWIAVRGKTEPAAMHELLGAAGETPAELLALRDRYEEGLAAYRRLDWRSAMAALRGVLELNPEDGPSKILLTRISHMEAQPPAAGWDGVWHLDEK
jgi:class 3 adenylate cyclase